jgi:multidrug resistance efflux pump
LLLGGTAAAQAPTRVPSASPSAAPSPSSSPVASAPPSPSSSPVASASPSVAPSVAASEAPPSPSPVPEPASVIGRVQVHATYGLGFGRDAVLVPRGAALSGATSPGPWVVMSVAVAVGDPVTAGDVLATADVTALDLGVLAAEAAVAVADEKLAKDLARPTDNERAKADAVLGQAQQRLDAAVQTLADTKEQTLASVRGAKSNVDVQDRILRADTRSNQLPTVLGADQRALTAARVLWRNAIALGAVNDSRAQQAVDAARLALEAAVVDHDVATSATAPDVLAADRAALATAQLNLAKAQAAAKGGVIVAPVDGVVSNVFIVEGASAQAGDAIQLQQGPMEAVVPISESIIASIAPGQRASIEIPALGVVLTGWVSAVSMSPTSDPDATEVTYPVVITIDDGPEGLRQGMTAKVILSTPD